MNTHRRGIKAFAAPLLSPPPPLICSLWICCFRDLVVVVGLSRSGSPDLAQTHLGRGTIMLDSLNSTLFSACFACVGFMWWIWQTSVNVVGSFYKTFVPVVSARAAGPSRSEPTAARRRALIEAMLTVWTRAFTAAAPLPSQRRIGCQSNGPHLSQRCSPLSAREVQILKEHLKSQTLPVAPSLLSCYLLLNHKCTHLF